MNPIDFWVCLALIAFIGWFISGIIEAASNLDQLKDKNE